MIPSYDNEPVLCYIEGCFAYFTTQPLDKQWGDDWNDAPYEHNAGRPYGWYKKDRAIYTDANGEETYEWKDKSGVQYTFLRREDLPDEEQDPKWEISKLVWDGPFEDPANHHYNSPWCVQQINRGAVAWLTPDRWTMDKYEDARPIPAGVNKREFTRLIEAAGGTVYIPYTPSVKLHLKDIAYA